jgi:hypothetical protein
MNATLFQNLAGSLSQVKIFDLQLVDGHCISPFEINFVSPDNSPSYVRAIAFPDTEREHSVLIDKADIVENLATGEVSGSVWIDLDLDAPTTLSESLGAAIEAKCRERMVSDK